MKIKLIIASLCAFSVLSVNAKVIHDHKSLKELQDLTAFTADSVKDTEITKEEDIEFVAMKNAAFAVGAQNGYIAQMNKLKAVLMSQKDSLDDIFDFNTLIKMSSTGDAEVFLLPPVIAEADNLLSVSESSKKIRVSGKYYKIVKDARLASSPPDWRSYLLLDNTTESNKINEALLPETPKEKALWAEWVKDGWYAGVELADREMRSRVRKLGADFVGMIKFTRLMIEGKVNKPQFASSYQSVVGGGSEMRQNESVYEITADAYLKADSSKWTPLILDNREGLLFEDEKEFIKDKVKP